MEKDVVIPGLPSCQVQQLYRAIDFLLECSEEIQWAVFSSCANLLNLEVDLLYFDTKEQPKAWDILPAQPVSRIS